MARRRAYLLLVTAILVLGVLAQNLIGAAGKAETALTAQAIGLVDPVQIQEKYPDFVRLMELKKVYDNELNKYTTYIQSQLQSYLLELSKKEEAESEGKSAEEKKAIQAKYAKLAQDKRAEFTQQSQTKMKELQDKLNLERDKAEAKMEAAIAEVAAEQDLGIVLNKQAVYFGGTDITAMVIAKGEEKK